VLKLLYAVPNGGDRNLRVPRKLKAEGVMAGVADLCLPAARRGYHGLYLEIIVRSDYCSLTTVQAVVGKAPRLRLAGLVT
jgi:hypothetical protein